MIEDIEELRVESQLHVLGYREPLRQIEVVPHKIRAAQSIASEIPELVDEEEILSRGFLPTP
jgi:hypothetical protein